jgi:hypothetical protein
MSITTKDNTKEVLSAMEKAFERGLKSIGLTAEGHAKEDPNMPVDTGLARNSITFAISGKEANTKSYKADKGDETGEYSGTAPDDKEKAVYLGSNVEYFEIIELGGPNITARHVLQNACTQHSDEYQELMEDSMKNA